MLFLVRFKTYLYFVLPTVLVSQTLLTMLTMDIYGGDFANCPQVVKNFSLGTALTREMTLITYFTIGVYVFHNILVGRFLNSEKAQLQQKHLV